MSLATYGDVDRIMETVLPFISGMQLIITALICFTFAFLLNMLYRRQNIISKVLGWFSTIIFILGILFAIMEWIKN